MPNLRWISWANMARGAAALLLAAFVLSTCSGLQQFEKEIGHMGGIRLGDTRSEVLYRLGVPPRVFGDPHPIEVGGETFQARTLYWVTDAPQPVNAMPEGSKIEDYSAWTYAPSGDAANFTVEFDAAGRVNLLECTALGGRPFACGPVAGVWNTDSEEKVLRMGRPTRETIDGVTKLMAYDDIGVRFLLTKGRVYRISLVAPGAKPNAAISRYFERRFP